MLLNVVNNIRGKEKIISYALGRFKVVRHIYSKYRSIQQTISRLEIAPKFTETIFDSLQVDSAVKEIEKHAVFLGIKLPDKQIEEIKDFAKNTQLTREDRLASFVYSDVKNGYLPDGRPVPQAIATNPLECDAIQQIISDPILLKIIEKYLGYYPTTVHPILKWSFVLELPDNMRVKLHQTVTYHYDIYGFNFVYANFYLSNTDRYSGAHVMIKDSHNKKTWQMLFHSANQTDVVLHNYYGKENELVIEAEEGFGFIQDASCYHKALKPIHGERLMLQIRFT